MGFVSSLLGILGFVFGIPFGLVLGFLLFIYSEPKEVKDPVIRSIHELDTNYVQEELIPWIPFWVKSPDYERVDWLNHFLLDMWPFLNKAICNTIRSTTELIFAEYIGKYQIKAIEWACNSDIVLGVKLLNMRITLQLLDLQIFAAPRVSLKPLVPTFPCFAKAVVSLMEKPHVDFGMRVLGGDIMSIPGLYRYVQETIRKQVANLYHWPQTLEVPILDASSVAIKKPVGVLHVKVVQAFNLLKMDILGTSDPYVKLSLTGERLPSKKTTIKMKNLNPVWNENFKLIVKDPESQVLQLRVYDWDKVGAHDRLGMQLVPLNLLTPNETKEFKLELLKNSNINDPHNKKSRGQLVVELTYNPFKQDHDWFSGPLDGYKKMESQINRISDSGPNSVGGVLLVTIQGAEDVEGEGHNNPYALILFRGEKKKTKRIKRTRDPIWNEEFQFMLEEPPLEEKIRIEVMSKRRRIVFSAKESLGYVEINLSDVVHNGRINHKYHLIDSKNGVIQIEIQWKLA
ncbi:C2 domain [Dillenia turbinata]|uniref:C2 domain n=1 Tax=Dillenia turbinata TaxID=194707 RepID=A0AAN8V7Z0_9MAGN